MSITHAELRSIDLPVRTSPAQRAPAELARGRHLRAIEAVPQTESTNLRLTRRGRITVVAAALVLLAMLMVAFGSTTAATGEAGHIVETTSMTVQPGQTLWSIAAAANPRGDIRDTVDDIVRMNSLEGSSLLMGTRLAVPVYGN